MALAIQLRMTLSEFDAWASAQYDHNYEFIGEIWLKKFPLRSHHG